MFFSTTKEGINKRKQTKREGKEEHKEQ